MLAHDEARVRGVFRTGCNTVYLSGKCRVAQWRHHGWLNAASPVAHQDLWCRLLQLVNRFGTQFECVEVSVHCGVPKNEQAHSVADEGRFDGPLFLVPLASWALSSVPVDNWDLSDQVQSIQLGFLLLDCVHDVAGLLDYDTAYNGAEEQRGPE